MVYTNSPTRTSPMTQMSETVRYGEPRLSRFVSQLGVIRSNDQAKTFLTTTNPSTVMFAMFVAMKASADKKTTRGVGLAKTTRKLRIGGEGSVYAELPLPLSDDAAFKKSEPME